MLVCHCRRVSDREIRAFVRKGTRSVRDVCRSSGAGSRCGGCMPLVRELVRTEGEQVDESGPSAIGSRIAATGVYR